MRFFCSPRPAVCLWPRRTPFRRHPSPTHAVGDPASRRKLFFRTGPKKPISPLRTSFVTPRPAADFSLRPGIAPPSSPHAVGDPAARRKLFFRTGPKKPISPLRTSFVTPRLAVGFSLRPGIAPPSSPHAVGDPASRRKLFFRTGPKKPISPLRTSFVTPRPAGEACSCGHGGPSSAPDIEREL